MDTSTKCRCCLERDSERDLYSTYLQYGKGENYAEMIKECFDIEFVIKTVDDGICPVCISRLRDAFDFKQQVLSCQRNFTVTVNVEVDCKDELQVKEEVCVPENSAMNLGSISNMVPANPESTVIKEPNSTAMSPRNESDLVNEYESRSSINDETTLLELLNRKHQPPLWVNQAKENTETEPSVESEVMIEKKKKCPFCSAEFVREFTLIKHVRRHKEKPFKCDLCDYASHCKATLATHKTSHSSEPHKCEHCDFTTDRLVVLRKHITTHGKRFKCDFCEYRGRSSYYIKVHERTHTGDKPYKCQHCEFRAATTQVVKTHERTHTGEKPYECDLCDYKSAQKYAITTHKLTHTGETHFKCSMCEYRCKHKSTLNAHELRHKKKMKKADNK